MHLILIQDMYAINITWRYSIMSKYASYEVCYIVVYVVNKLIEQGIIKPEDKNKALLKSEGITHSLLEHSDLTHEDIEAEYDKIMDSILQELNP